MTKKEEIKKEVIKKEVIKKVIKGEMTRKEAMAKLYLSRQQVYRLIKNYLKNGDKCFINGNKGKQNKNRIDNTVIEKIQNLYIEEYYDYNFIAFYEVLQEKYKDEYEISYSSLYRMFQSGDIVSPLAHKGTLRLYNEKMENAISDKTVIDEKSEKIYESRQIAIEKAHTRRSSNSYGFGQEVQMDACENIWFGDRVTYLHLAVDKGTKKVLFGWFEYEEITRGYFVLLYNIIINYGIPTRIKTDNRNSFSNQQNKVDTTQFGTICGKLGIELITTSSPTSKPNVERENGTFKNRLISELRHEEITDMDAANAYVNEKFIPRMNKTFSFEINKKTSKMKPNNYTEEELNLIISERKERIIDNASSIKYENYYYVPVKLDTGEQVCFTKGTKCIVILSYHAELWCEIENVYYKLCKIEKRETVMKKEKENNKPIEKKKTIVPKNTPWRKFKINTRI